MDKEMLQINLQTMFEEMDITNDSYFNAGTKLKYRNKTFKVNVIIIEVNK